MFAKGILTAGLAALVTAMPASATILTFDATGGVTNFENVDQGYCDRVTVSPDAAGNGYGFGAEGGTPNVVIGYGTPGEDPALWTTGFGSLTNILFNDADGDTTFTTTFTADDGWLVNLYGFDIASFFTAGQTIQGLSVFDLDTNTALFSVGSTFVQGVTFDTFDFGASPLTAQRLGLVVNLTGLGGVSDDIGVDNIRFGQERVMSAVVPEPAQWAMLLAGFGLTGATMRRRRQGLPVVA